MNIDRLYDLRESKVLDEEDRQKIDLILQAITDWPTNTETVEDFLREIKGYLKTDTLTFEMISSKSKQLNPQNSMWQLEALSSLLQLTEADKSKTADMIINQVSSVSQ